MATAEGETLAERTEYRKGLHGALRRFKKFFTAEAVKNIHPKYKPIIAGEQKKHDLVFEGVLTIVNRRRPRRSTVLLFARK